MQTKFINNRLLPQNMALHLKDPVYLQKQVQVHHLIFLLLTALQIPEEEIRLVYFG